MLNSRARRLSIGHDKNMTISPYIAPSLTTVDPHFHLIGKKIAEKLVREIWIDDITIQEGSLIENKSISVPCK